MQSLSGERNSFASKRTCSKKERNVYQGNAIVLGANASILRKNAKFIGGAIVLRANANVLKKDAKFIRGTQSVCKLIQVFYDRTQSLSG